MLVIGTSLSGLASDCVPEVGRRHDSECFCVIFIVLLLLLYSAVFFCVASSWRWFRILFFCCCVVIETSFSGLVYDCIPVEWSSRRGSEFLLLFFCNLLCCFFFWGVLPVLVGVGDVCFFLTMRCFNDAMFSNS